MEYYSYKSLSEDEAKENCRKLFIVNYIYDANNNKILIYTSAGERVVFEENDFQHAFTYRDKHTGLEKFSFQRARRILWIKEVVSGNCPSVRKDIGKEVYFYYNSAENYLVFLKKMSRGDLRFITHYVAKNRRKQAWIARNILP
jgi:hypothetical protein